jgi:hypothetical protein
LLICYFSLHLLLCRLIFIWQNINQYVPISIQRSAAWRDAGTYRYSTGSSLWWDELGQRIDINCFQNEPSIKSSLKFLRRTPWARAKVEDLYVLTQNSPWVKKEPNKE